MFLCRAGYTLEAQKQLFDNIRPLFANKPLIVVANKADIWREDLQQDKRDILDKVPTYALYYWQISIFLQILIFCDFL